MSFRIVSLVVLLTMVMSAFALVPGQQAPPAQAGLPAEAAAEHIRQAPVTQAGLADVEPTPSIALQPIGTYNTGTLGAAEVVAYDAASERLFVTNASTSSVDILSITDPTSPTLVATIDTNTVAPPYGGSPNSVAVANGVVAVAIQIDSVPLGAVVFFDTDGTELAAAQVGALPDMVTFTPDGSTLLVANEGEPNDAYTLDPPGSISIIELPADFASNPVVPTVTNLGFEAFNAGGPRYSEIADQPIRVFGRNSAAVERSTVAQDLEPEYISVSPDGSTAYVAMQENNALAVVDIASRTITAIVGLGFKNHSLPGNELDASNRDDTINIRNWPVRGMYQPDSIATFEVDGETYIVTANEGDARDYDGFSEEFRVGDLALDTSVFTNAETLQEDENLGRLRVTNVTKTLADPGLVRLIHASPLAGEVDIDILEAGTTTIVASLQGVTFGTISDYIELPGGVYDVSVSQTGVPNAAPLLVVPGLAVQGGTELSAAVTDAGPFPIVDDLTPPLADTAHVRVYHLSPDAGPVDVRLLESGVPTATVIDDLAFPQPNVYDADQFGGSAYLALEPGVYDLAVTPADDDDTTIVVDLSGTELEAGNIYSIFAVGNIMGATPTFTTAVQVQPALTNRLWSYGARSFTVWNTSGEVVYDSGSEFAEVIAGTYPAFFNMQASFDDGETPPVFEGFAFDDRSDDKGAEPEAIATGVVDGRTYAFVGLERMSGVMVYDVTDPTAPTFVQYVNNIDFDGNPFEQTAGDVAPEIITFIDAADSPNGSPLVVVANEVSGSTTIYEVGDPDGAATLTLLHNNDGESSLLASTVNVDGTNLPVGSIGAFATVYDTMTDEARAAGNAVLGVYAGDAFLASASLQCSFDDAEGRFFDAIAQNLIGYDAHILGNHEFDFGPDTLLDFINAFTTNGVLVQPFLSANLDFSAAEGYADLLDEDGVIVGFGTDGEVIGASYIHTDRITGQRFGVVSAITPGLGSISDPDTVIVNPNVAAIVQNEVNRLTSDLGLNKIIFVSHLQSLAATEDVIGQVTGVDVAVSGGGDELLLNEAVSAELQLLPGTDPADSIGSYPATVADAAQNNVPLVTGPGQYNYLGRLDVSFDADGNVTSVDNTTSYLRRVIPQSPEAATLGIADAVERDATIVDLVENEITDCIADLSTALAETEIALDVSRVSVRTGEANGGNVVADSFLFTLDRVAAFSPTVQTIVASAPVVSVQNGGGIRQNAPTGDTIEVGDITLLTAQNVLPFSNDVTLVENITPEELKNIFEFGVRRLPESTPGEFLQVAGITVTVDLSATARDGETYADSTESAGERITELTLADGTAIVQNGMVITGAPSVSLLVNSFMAGGGDGYTVLEDKPQTNLANEDGTLVSYQQAFVDYVSDLGTIEADDPRYQPGGEGRITIGGSAVEAPLDLVNGTSVTLSDPVNLGGISLTVTIAPSTVISNATGIITSATLRVSSVAPALADAGLANALERYFRIELIDENGEPFASPISFDPPVTVLLGYTDADLADTPEESVGLFFFDETGTTWTQGDIARTDLDTAANLATFAVPHLTLFGLAQLDTEPQPVFLPFVRRTSGAVPADVTLTLLHNNDGESGLLPTMSSTDGQTITVGGAAAFNAVATREISAAAQAGNAAVMVYAGDAFLASATIQCSFPIDSDEPIYDAIAQTQMPYTAHILGNHEFDYTPDFLQRFIEAFGGDQPFLTANLDFSGEPGLAALVDEDGIIEGAPADGRVIGQSLIYTDPTTGAQFGIVGATTADLASVSSPRNVTVTPDIVASVQEEIDALLGQGVNKIVFVSHLQSAENDRELIEQLTGVDVAVGGGGDNFLVNASLDQGVQLIPGNTDADDIEGEYPIEITDAAGRTVYLVTSIDRYRYLGRLDLKFDAAGEVIRFVDSTSYPRRVVAAGDSATALGITDAVTPDASIITSVNTPVIDCLDELGTEAVATTEILLDVSRDGVRGGENNTGNLVADSFLDAYDTYATTSGLDARDLDTPVVALQNGGGIRQNAGDVLPRAGTVPGPISRLDTIDVLPFNNFISVVRGVTPTLLLDILDNRSTSGIYHVANLNLVYNTTTDDEGDTRYVIDSMTLLQTDGSEVPLVTDGAPVDGAPAIDIVTNSFVAARELGGVTDQVALVDSLGARLFYEQPLREYLLDLGTIAADDPRYQPGGEGRIVINP